MSKNKTKSNSNIKCDVVSCENNNCEEGTCILKSITISCVCNNGNCKCTEETICKDFEKK